MATCKPHQHAHLAAGIARIRQAIQDCKEPATVRGTIYTIWMSDLLFDYTNKHLMTNIMYPMYGFNCGDQ